MLLKYQNKVWVIIIICISYFMHNSIEASETTDSIKSLALKYFGEDCLSHANIQLSKIDNKILKFKDSKIPFSTELDSNKVLWKISINEIPSFSKTFTQELRDKYPRNLNIYIDSITGIPIKIVTRIKELPENLYIESNVGELEDELTRIGDEFFGMPSTPPSISFLDAFQSARHQNVRAKEIVAFYVIWGNSQYSPRPAWIIQLRGDIEEDSADVYPKLLKNTNYSTNIIDANTGKLVGGIEIRRNTSVKK